MSSKFQEISRIRREWVWWFRKGSLFLKISKGQHKIVRGNKQGKLVSYVLKNATKTWLFGLEISKNIKIEHVFQSKSFPQRL